eukprot:900001-Pyramimonas_sp.AAC.1
MGSTGRVRKVRGRPGSRSLLLPPLPPAPIPPQSALFCLLLAGGRASALVTGAAAVVFQSVWRHPAIRPSRETS